jgi:hypothetical protein
VEAQEKRIRHAMQIAPVGSRNQTLRKRVPTIDYGALVCGTLGRVRGKHHDETKHVYDDVISVIELTYVSVAVTHKWRRFLP